MWWVVATGARIPKVSSQGSASNSDTVTAAESVQGVRWSVRWAETVVVVAAGDELKLRYCYVVWTKGGNESKQVAVLFVRVWFASHLIPLFLRVNPTLCPLSDTASAV